jgi:hypothetical protein
MEFATDGAHGLSTLIRSGWSLVTLLKESRMGYYAPNPYEAPEAPRCLECDAPLVEAGSDFRGKPIWACHNLSCSDCSDKVKKDVDWFAEIDSIRKYLDSDVSLVAFCVREWDITEQAGLRDLAWVMCRDGYVSRNDAKGLLDDLEAFVERSLT